MIMIGCDEQDTTFLVFWLVGYFTMGTDFEGTVNPFAEFQEKKISRVEST